jgi:hypothetical protein
VTACPAARGTTHLEKQEGGLCLHATAQFPRKPICIICWARQGMDIIDRKSAALRILISLYISRFNKCLSPVTIKCAFEDTAHSINLLSSGSSLIIEIFSWIVIRFVKVEKSSQTIVKIFD